jgi:hypothetical protein
VRLRELPIDPKLLVQNSGALRSVVGERPSLGTEKRLA